MQSREDERASNNVADGIASHVQVSPGKAEPFLVPSELEPVSPTSQEAVKVASTALPLTCTYMAISARMPSTLGDTDVKIASNASNSVTSNSVTGTQAGCIQNDLPPSIGDTCTVTSKEGKLGAIISAAAAVEGKSQRDPTGDLDLKAQDSQKAQTKNKCTSNSTRLNKFVQRLCNMLESEKDSGIVEWRRGLLVLHSTDAFAKRVLPKYFNCHFKTFRRQLNYYGFVHVRSFSATGSTTTALWVNQELAKQESKDIASVLMLKRVKASDASKTAEGRRARKEEAASTVDDIDISTMTLTLEQIEDIQSLAPQEP